MQRVFRSVYSEIRGLHQSAYILALFAVGSQVLALVRDRLFAHHFGASTELDIYYAAFKIPDVLFVLFASILSVYVLIPFISEKTEKGDIDGARALLSGVLTVFVGAYILVALLLGVFASPVAQFLFPGFVGEDHATLVLLMRILLIQPLFLGISSLCGVITQLGQRFALYALSPLLYNGGIIFGVIVLYPTFGLSGVVWGVVLGAFLHLLIQLPFILQSPLSPTLTMDIDRKSFMSVLMNSVPRALTLSLNQIVFLAFAGIASAMAVGSVSIFQFALNLQSVPLAIIGVSYSVAAFPLLARLYSKGDKVAFVERVETALRHLVFWIIPIVGLLIVVRAQFVRVILGSGSFDWNDTRLTAATLALFLVSLIGQAVSLLIVRAYYAGGNTRTPFVVTVISSAMTLVVSLALYGAYMTQPSFAHALDVFMRVEGVPGTEIMMLALGYSLVQLVHMGVLLFLFVRMFALPVQHFFATCLRSVVATLIGSLSAYIVLNLLVYGIRKETFVGIFLQGFLAGVVGLMVVIGLLYLMKSPELKELWSSLRRRPLFVRIFGPDEVDTLAL